MEIAACQAGGEDVLAPVDLFVAMAGCCGRLADRLRGATADLRIFEQTQNGHGGVLAHGAVDRREGGGGMNVMDPARGTAASLEALQEALSAARSGPAGSRCWRPRRTRTRTSPPRAPPRRPQLEGGTEVQARMAPRASRGQRGRLVPGIDRHVRLARAPLVARPGAGVAVGGAGAARGQPRGRAGRGRRGRDRGCVPGDQAARGRRRGDRGGAGDDPGGGARLRAGGHPGPGRGGRGRAGAGGVRGRCRVPAHG